MNGMLSLIVDPHKVDAFTIGKNPVKFDIIVSLPGYAGVTRSITIQEYKTINIIVPLVKLDDTPEGVTVIENTSFASSSSPLLFKINCNTIGKYPVYSLFSASSELFKIPKTTSLSVGTELLNLLLTN